MTNLLKSVMRAVGALGNIFLASTAVFCAISEGKDDPIYAAFTIGVIVAMWNALIFVCTHWED